MPWINFFSHEILLWSVWIAEFGHMDLDLGDYSPNSLFGYHLVFLSLSPRFVMNGKISTLHSGQSLSEFIPPELSEET